jgi:NAD(P)H-dependent FMN reductase
MKRRITLSVERNAVERAQRYAELHGTTVSALVDSFLAHLPSAKADTAQLTPTVRRLLGIAAAADGVADYREHLDEKYGR